MVTRSYQADGRRGSRASGASERLHLCPRQWRGVETFWGVVSVFVVACASPDPIFVERRVEVFAPRSCAPGQPIEETVGPIEVLALGDFPLSDEGVENVTPTAPTTLERFPATTELVVARTQSEEWSAWGAREVSGAGASPLVLAPMGGACPLGDFELRAASGAALTSLDDGGALIVGGLASDRGFEGSRRLIRLPSDLSLSEVLPSQLSLGRLGATATETNGRVVIAGGARFEDERALDTFDVFDTRSGELAFRDRPLCAASDATCIGRRRDHGAGRLADGRVLLFGGVMRAGGADLREEILDTGVIVDPTAGEVDLVIDSDLGDGEPVPARRLPHVITLDSAETYVVGGQGEGGGWTPTVYRFDAERNGFDRVATLESDGSRDRFVVPPEPGVALALPGARIAYVTDGPRFTVLLFDGPTVVRRVEPTVVSSDFTGTLTGVRAIALPDGALFLTGADADSGAPLAFRVDLGEGVATRVDPPDAGAGTPSGAASRCGLECGCGGWLVSPHRPPHPLRQSTDHPASHRSGVADLRCRSRVERRRERSDCQPIGAGGSRWPPPARLLIPAGGDGRSRCRTGDGNRYRGHRSSSRGFGRIGFVSSRLVGRSDHHPSRRYTADADRRRRGNLRHSQHARPRFNSDAGRAARRVPLDSASASLIQSPS